MSNIFLSIIVAARNDNYGGDFIDRLQRCLDWNTRFIEANKIPTEFIIVNWNPITENKPLNELISFSQKREYVKYRIINVPSEIHNKYINQEIRQTVPLFEFIAKNTGIRRAAGEYILCINADILIHPKVFEFIGGNKIDKNYYYRTNRLDFKKIDSYDSVIDFYKAGYVVSLKGFEYYFKPLFDKRLQYHIFRFLNPIRIAWEFWKYRNYKLCNYFQISVTYDNATFYAHCLCSGDFMLMHKDHWLELRAYPEYTGISTHTDSIFTIFAYAKLKEYVFSHPVFHQEHERRYTWDAIKNEKPFHDALDRFKDIMKNLLSGKKTDNYVNGEDWGLAQFNLRENKY